MSHVGPEVESFAYCGGPFAETEGREVVDWSVQTTTPAELAVIAFLQSRPDLIAHKRLLHVGIGNSALFETLGGVLGGYTGITISRQEKTHFDRVFPVRAGAEALILNKHNPLHYSRVCGSYHVIVDVNLKSFACCERHYRSMIDFYAGLLAPDGLIVTAQSGLNFGWADMPDRIRTYTPGMKTGPELRPHRILGVEGLKELAERLGYVIERHPMPGIEHRLGQTDEAAPPLVMDEVLWTLQRGAAA